MESTCYGGASRSKITGTNFPEWEIWLKYLICMWSHMTRFVVAIAIKFLFTYKMQPFFKALDLIHEFCLVENLPLASQAHLRLHNCIISTYSLSLRIRKCVCSRYTNCRVAYIWWNARIEGVVLTINIRTVLNSSDVAEILRIRNRKWLDKSTWNSKKSADCDVELGWSYTQKEPNAIILQWL